MNRVRVLSVLLAALLVVTGCDVSGDHTSNAQHARSAEPQTVKRKTISETHPYETVPVIDAYYQGEKAWFIHTEVSAPKMAQNLTGMVGYHALHVPRPGRISPGNAGSIYVFKNGIDRKGTEPWGGGPFHHQIDILDSVPGDTDYTPLRNPHLVRWKKDAEPRVLRSVQKLMEAKRNGELTIKQTDVIVNAPVVKWPTDYLGGSSRNP